MKKKSEKTSHVPFYYLNGYKLVYAPNHPRKNEAGYVREHVIVMEQHIGRYLTDDEVVHHIDFNRGNNDISNLRLMTRSMHSTLHGKLMAKEKGNHLKEEKKCILCGSPTARFGTLCKVCQIKQQTKIQLPPIDILVRLVNEKNMEEVARIVGVTSNVLRKWLNKLGIRYTPQKNKGMASNFTPETRRKARLTQLEYYKTHRGNGTIPIAQCTRDGTVIRNYDCIADVSNFGFNKACVSRVVSGNRETYKGFLWKRI